jgi:hypothetical protein
MGEGCDVALTPVTVQSDAFVVQRTSKADTTNGNTMTAHSWNARIVGQSW